MKSLVSEDKQLMGFFATVNAKSLERFRVKVDRVKAIG